MQLDRRAEFPPSVEIGWRLRIYRGVLLPGSRIEKGETQTRREHCQLSSIAWRLRRQ